MPHRKNFALKEVALKSNALKQHNLGVLSQKTEIHDDLLHYLEPAEMNALLQYNPAKVYFLGKIKMDSTVIDS